MLKKANKSEPNVARRDKCLTLLVKLFARAKGKRSIRQESCKTISIIVKSRKTATTTTATAINTVNCIIRYITYTQSGTSCHQRHHYHSLLLPLNAHCKLLQSQDMHTHTNTYTHKTHPQTTPTHTNKLSLGSSLYEGTTRRMRTFA